MARKAASSSLARASALLGGAFRFSGVPRSGLLSEWAMKLTASWRIATMTSACQHLAIARRLAWMANLLLIDDDPAIIPAQLRQAFPAPAHRVEVAATGAEGLERLTADPPDVILLDLGLPDQSGLEVYAKIRTIDGRIPVIFVTMAKS